MRPRASDNTRTRRTRRRRGFSLAELMVALAVLALGLLVIGAALPVGVRYTRQSIDMATGQAAAEQALNLIEQNLSLPETILDLSGGQIREPGLFQPRSQPTADPPGELDPGYEPLIKVRPLFTHCIDARPGSGTYGQQVPWDGKVGVEDRIREWLTAIFGAGNNTKECDPTAINNGPWLRPALSSVALAYPPISADLPYVPGSFLGTGGFEVSKYVPKPVSPAEALKALERRVTWTAFYRRVSYDADSDPALYEFIVVAVYRPSPNHRFPLLEDGGDAAFVYGEYKGNASAAPVPWLVTFNAPLPAPPGGGFDPNGFPNMGGQGEPATLRFEFDPPVAAYQGLFPVGTIFIPARNDAAPNDVYVPAPDMRVGFGPPAPTTLPIYEVVDRPDATTVVVKFNGFYPRKGADTPAPGEWPVWVIPPAFEEVDGNNRPVFGKRSPILAVARRYIRLREIP